LTIMGVTRPAPWWPGILWFVLLGLMMSCTAQVPPSPEFMAGFRAPEKQKQFSAPAVLAEFDAGGDSVYRLGEGDEITVDVWGRPELSGKHIIGPDGKITIPYAGVMNITGLSRDGAAKAIAEALSPYYYDVLVTVRVDRYVANRIFILGRVANPGMLTFDTSPTLLEAITRAGSLPVGGVGADKAALVRCAIFRDRDRIAWIDLRRLLTGEDLSLNVRLQRNDVVYIPDADDQLVYVLGEVKTPGAYQVTPNMSFLDALARAGGPSEDATTDTLYVVRPQLRAHLEFALQDLLRPTPELNVAVEEGDIIYVPRRGLAKFGYVMRQLSPLSFLVLFGR
jgi:polysaccharide biosynthesis/export protein